MSNNITNEDYVNVVRQLPRPSTNQIARFANYVANAHSWYKHLPIYPKVPFCFFLDPNAGKKMIYDQAGKVRFEDETSEKGFHYTHQTTDRYRERFGHLNYYQGNYGTSFRLPLENGGLASTESSIGLKILGLQGETLEISSRLTEIGTAYLSAFVHRHININIMMDRFCIRKVSLESDLNLDLPKVSLESDLNLDFLATLEQAPSILSEQLGFLWAVLNTKGWYPLNNDTSMVNHDIYKIDFRDIIPIDQSKLERKYLSEEDRKFLLQTWKEELSTLKIAEAMEILLQTWEEKARPTTQEEYQSFDPDEKEFIRSLVKESLVSEIMYMTQEEEIFTFWKSVQKHNVKSFSTFVQKRYPVETNLANHLAREQILQLESMQMAMNNFLDAVYE